tara:strand:+ start:394 stop:666 length:273 start_codon:yes stop_codon:yes gene_type:complete
MGIKKIARPINKAKNLFIKWLKDNDGESISEYEGEQDSEWDYYRCVSGFIGSSLYTVYFTIWEGFLRIDYSDEENKYERLSIEEFNDLIN